MKRHFEALSKGVRVGLTKFIIGREITVLKV